MSKKITISVYYTIIRKLRRGGASFEEILSYIENESLTGEVFEMSKRTFQRYIKDIYDIFNVEIRFNKSKGMYFISEDESGIQERVFEAFDLLNALKMKDRLANYIQLESKEIQNTNFIPTIIKAISNNHITHFRYHKYGNNATTEREVEPYLLKEYHNRWFLLAKDKKDGVLKTFALDRVSNLIQTDKHFGIDKTIDAIHYFEHSIGIITPSKNEAQTPQKIIMKVDDFQRKYLQSLPFHKSQTITSNEKEENILSLTVFITHDLEMEILALGENVVVLEPEFLVDRIIQRLKRNIENY